MAESLTDRIQELLNQRQGHVDALATIDQTLAGIHSLLGVVKPGRKPGPKPAAAPPAVEAPVALPRKRGWKRGKFATTGQESILAFVKERKNPTTKQINANWKQEGRGGTADSLLGSLVKVKQLKRKKLGGKLGSQYLLA